MTWTAMAAACTAKGHELCTYEELCPSGLNSIPSGRTMGTRRPTPGRPSSRQTALRTGCRSAAALASRAPRTSKALGAATWSNAAYKAFRGGFACCTTEVAAAAAIAGATGAAPPPPVPQSPEPPPPTPSPKAAAGAASRPSLPPEPPTEYRHIINSVVAEQHTTIDGVNPPPPPHAPKSFSFKKRCQLGAAVRRRSTSARWPRRSMRRTATTFRRRSTRAGRWCGTNSRARSSPTASPTASRSAWARATRASATPSSG